MSYGGSGYSALAQVLARSQTGGGMLQAAHRFLHVCLLLSILAHVDSKSIRSPKKTKKSSWHDVATEYGDKMTLLPTPTI